MTFHKLFVTATGTDVGKTVISAALLDATYRRQIPLQYWKPVQTGGVDIDRHGIEAILGHAISCPLPTAAYDLPASPDQAAKAENAAQPTLGQLLETMRQQPEQPLLIEGAGGLMVPLNDQNETWLDFMIATEVPVILVASSGLGTINHTVLSLNMLETYGITVLAVVLNGPIHEANLESLRRMKPEHRFISFPHLDLGGPCSPAWIEAGDSLWNALNARERPPAADDWIEHDASVVWHPYTQHKTSPSPIPIVRAKGIYLYTREGEELIDASASWWTCSLGHGHPQVGAAIRRQQARLDHCVFAGATHQPAVELAKQLVDRSEGHLQRVFYSDNGSCAVEVALKMAAQSWINKGQTQRKTFLYFKGAYHGDTFGAMSVADAEGLHRTFKSYLFRALFATPVTSHASSICPEGPSRLEAGCRELDALFAQHGDELAGVLIEPWLQGASGMNIQDLAWLKHLDGLCKRYGVPFILDEVFTGMGRIGAHYAFLRAGINPDIVCIAKGLTGGSLPLAATLTREEIFADFYHDERGKALLHGHTFTGHPIACAAALATLRVYDQQAILDRALFIEQRLGQWLEEEGRQLELENSRVLGAMMAWELPGTGLGDYFHPLALDVPPLARRHGLMMRTLGNTLYFVPPLLITGRELDTALERISHCMEDLLARPTKDESVRRSGGIETPYSC
jgi:adenosylmethionine-8-amino-7-oxononanoate aminotransferase